MTFIEIYFLIAVLAFGIVTVADITTEGEGIGWTARIAVALFWPVFACMVWIDMTEEER